MTNPATPKRISDGPGPDIGTLSGESWATSAPVLARFPADPLRGALLDSRQRWRDLVTLAADLAFETDAQGRFLFVIPSQILGWAADSLIGQPASLLLADSADSRIFNPFRTTVTVRGQRVWVRRADGGVANLTFSAAPICDAMGSITGARGVGIDMTEYTTRGEQIAAALRRGQVVDHILGRVGREVLAPRMMEAALDALMKALGGEGTGVVVLHADGSYSHVLHQVGMGAEAVLDQAARLLAEHPETAAQGTGIDGQPLLTAGCRTRFGGHAGLAVWRSRYSRPWDSDDRLLIAAASSIVRMILEQEAIQGEMVRQARTDPLTGLLNRRAFLEEVTRHTERLDRESLPGTLMFADLDHFKPVNDRLGHEVGDQVLIQTAEILRGLVRPADLVARLGGDEFAVWMSGTDHLTAAERAEHLSRTAPRQLEEIVGADHPGLGMSIGIATRQAGSSEPMDSLIRRADLAMYEVKRHGRGHWRVSHAESG